MHRRAAFLMVLLSVTVPQPASSQTAPVPSPEPADRYQYQRDLQMVQALSRYYWDVGHAPPSFTKTGEVHMVALAELPTLLDPEGQYREGAEAETMSGRKGRVKYIIYDRFKGFLAYFVRRLETPPPGYEVDEIPATQLRMAGFRPPQVDSRSDRGMLARVKSFYAHKIRWQPLGSLQVSHLVHRPGIGWIASVSYRKAEEYNLEGMVFPDSILYTTRTMHVKYLRFGSDDYPEEW